MKKFFLMLAVALPMFFMASCGDEDETSISLDKTVLTLDYSQSAELTASEKNGVWASSDEFVASVDQKGKVTANHEGKATITVSKNGESASCVVTVKTTNDFFCTITKWDITTNQLKSMLTSFTFPKGLDEKPLAEESYVDEDGDQIYNVMYSALGGKYPWYGFFFDDDDLEGSSVIFSDDEFDNEDFQGFLDQRYQKLANYNNEYGEGTMYLDNVSYSLANMSALVSITDDGDWEILYRPVSHTKGELINASIADAAKALRIAAKK